ncbi:hypothetical protein L7F22_029802 [Adiantum nelumboides]|nr:hypothetical protein [Adiantum nelumboides]
MVKVCSPTVVCDKSTMQQKSTLLAPPISSTYKLFKDPPQLEAGAYPARKWQKRRFNEENVMSVARVRYSSLDRQAMDLLRSSRDYSFLHAQDEEDDIATAVPVQNASAARKAGVNLAVKRAHNPAVIISRTPTTAIPVVVSKVCAPSPASLATSCRKSIIASSASKKAFILTDHTVNDADGRSNYGSSKSTSIPDSAFKKSSDLTANYNYGLTSDSKSSKCSVSKKLPSNPTEKLHLPVAGVKPTKVAQKRPNCTAAMAAAAPKSKHNIKSSITSTSRSSTAHDEFGSKSFYNMKVKKVNMRINAEKPAEGRQDQQQLGHGLHNAIWKMLGPRRTYHDITDAGDGSIDEMDMESSFHDIQREERRSAKIARKEDRREQELLLLQQEVERRAIKNRRRFNMQ